MEEQADIIITPVVGPEVITGSTRMKAGTAQKMALNMLSTAVMVRLGKTFSNLMVDMQTSNSKLQRRAWRIVAPACETREEEAGRALDQAGGEMKTAIVAVLAGISPAEARVRLAQSGGIVRRALEHAAEQHP
jgi:N-acetylmuramic acid 6-phosphate etherase